MRTLFLPTVILCTIVGLVSPHALADGFSKTPRSETKKPSTIRDPHIRGVQFHEVHTCGEHVKINIFHDPTIKQEPNKWRTFCNKMLNYLTKNIISDNDKNKVIRIMFLNRNTQYRYNTEDRTYIDVENVLIKDPFIVLYTKSDKVKEHDVYYVFDSYSLNRDSQTHFKNLNWYIKQLVNQRSKSNALIANKQLLQTDIITKGYEVHSSTCDHKIPCKNLLPLLKEKFSIPPMSSCTERYTHSQSPLCALLFYEYVVRLFNQYRKKPSDGFISIWKKVISNENSRIERVRKNLIPKNFSRNLIDVSPDIHLLIDTIFVQHTRYSQPVAERADQESHASYCQHFRVPCN